MDYAIEIVAGLYVTILAYDFYSYYFKTNLNTDNVDLVKAYVKRRGR